MTGQIKYNADNCYHSWFEGICSWEEKKDILGWWKLILCLVSDQQNNSALCFGLDSAKLIWALFLKNFLAELVVWFLCCIVCYTIHNNFGQLSLE